MTPAQRRAADWPDQPEPGRHLMTLWQEPWRRYHGPQHLATHHCATPIGRTMWGVRSRASLRAELARLDAGPR